MSDLTRRRFLQYGFGAGAALAVPWAFPRAASGAMGSKLRVYVDRLPVPGDGIIVKSGADAYAFTQRAIARRLHRDLPATPIWAYDDSSGLGGQAGSFGTVIVAHKGTPLDVSFTNALPETYPSWIPVDPRLTPFRTESGEPQVRVMTHLHGGFVAAANDGNPAATPELFSAGQTQTVHYPNEQPASLLWFHDHGLGTTRLNVFAGLAAGYLLRDEYDTGGDGNANGLPSGAYEIPLVIQDRQFNPDGTLLYPTSDIPGVVWIGEYFGNVMLVNGKVWPYLEVEPRLYRFRVLNGCNARILNVNFGGAGIWQIGAEGGMWDKPVPVNRLLLAPAERADVLVDFSKLAGSSVAMRNATLPSPVSSPAPALPTVMQFRVAGMKPLKPKIPTTLTGGTKAALAPPPVDQETRSRFITLNEADVDTPEWELTLNAAGFDDAPATETPKAGTSEDWYYINLTGDTHPMHMHLVTFQVIGRVPFDVERYTEDHEIEGGQGVPGGIDPTPYVTGPMVPADATERGFKDTVKVNPGSFTIIRAKFNLPLGVTAPQTYVHHCHIVEHEDNDMMRPFTVTP
jgi:spore coat protein A, manganese oxidase